MTVTLDTNLLVYAADPDSGSRHEAAKILVHRLARGEGKIALQVLGEFYNVMTRKIRVKPVDARSFIDDWRRVFPIFAATQEAFDDALDAGERHNLPFWDALLWATAKFHDCRFVLTDDFQDGRSLGGVTFLNPFEPKNARRLDRVLPKL